MSRAGLAAAAACVTSTAVALLVLGALFDQVWLYVLALIAAMPIGGLINLALYHPDRRNYR